MSVAPLIIGPHEKAALAELRQLAVQHPIDMRALMSRIHTPDGKRAHMDQMNSQTIDIPTVYLVTFSIEHGHPIGACRHMSMSSTRNGKVPVPQAIWMVAEELGFVGGLELCEVYKEDLQRGPGRAIAINVIQPIAAINIMRNPYAPN
jgi:hypothetical protein